MEGFVEAQKLAAYATPEVRGLFEDWVKAMEASVVEFIKEKETSNPEEIATHLEISVESAAFIIGKLVREGRLRVHVVLA